MQPSKPTPKAVTPSDIAHSLAKGFITVDDLQKIIDGWRPQKRGPKDNLITQARRLAVLQLLVETGKNESAAFDVLLAKLLLTDKKALKRQIERARKNWDVFPVFDADQESETRAISLRCKHQEHIGYITTIGIKPKDWTL
jgi:hypothetical protein